jgi:hypothetical protein
MRNQEVGNLSTFKSFNPLADHSASTQSTIRITRIVTLLFEKLVRRADPVIVVILF